MAGLGIPGELHERPWRDFGFNRSEALQLAQGKADYIWVMDADDTLEGTPDFQGLTADCYLMLVRVEQTAFWRRQLFRNGVPWRYEAVLHEYAVCDIPHSEANLEGDYCILGRHLGARTLDPMKLDRDCEVLLAQVQRNPDDAHAIFYLAQSYEFMEDHRNARLWWERRAQMLGEDQVVFYAMLRMARAMNNLGEPWADVQEAYLRAWEFRPTRAEALEAIAFHYIECQQYELGYLFAARAARIPPPQTDTFAVYAHVHEWRAADEQAVCASWIVDRQAEALTIWRRLLTRLDVPDDDRARMITNRDVVAAQLLQACVVDPADLMGPLPGSRDGEVTVRVVAGSDRVVTEATVNSFLRCCTDLDRVGRFVVVDEGLAEVDRAVLVQRYPFVDFVSGDERVGGRYVLELRQGWRFFTEEALISRLVGVLEAEPRVSAVGVNLGDAIELSAASPARVGVLTTAAGGRYVLADADPLGPVMIDTTRGSGVFASLDEVLCVCG